MRDQNYILLDVPFVAQRRSQWCWAACCSMLARHHLRREVSPAEVAKRWSADQGPGDGDGPLTHPQLVPHLYAQWGLETEPLEPPSLSGIRRSIEEGHPVLLAYWQSEARRHQVVAVGVEGPLVMVQDPATLEPNGEWRRFHEVTPGPRGQGRFAGRAPPAWAWSVRKP